MVFSDTTNLTGLVQDADFICGTDATSYPLKDKARSANRHYYVAVSDIIKSSGRWQPGDPNATTLPIPTFTLVDGQRQYSLPDSLLTLDAVEIKDAGGNWIRLKEIDIADLKTTITDAFETKGLPEYYSVEGLNLNLYPAPASGSVTLSAGGKLYISTEVDVFTADDISQEPGFAEPYHRIISMGMSMDWLLVNGPAEKHDRLQAQYEALRRELREFYSNRNEDVRVAFRPAHRTADSV